MHPELIDLDKITIPPIKKWHELRRRGWMGKQMDEIIAEYQRLESLIAKKKPLNHSQAFQLLSIAAILWREELANREDVVCEFSKNRNEAMHQMVESVLKFLFEGINP